MRVAQDGVMVPVMVRVMVRPCGDDRVVRVQLACWDLGSNMRELSVAMCDIHHTCVVGLARVADECGEWCCEGAVSHIKPPHAPQAEQGALLGGTSFLHYQRKESLFRVGITPHLHHQNRVPFPATLA